MRRLLWTGCGLALAIAGCDNGRAMHPDASSLFTCMTNADCDDHIACTVDSCGVGAVCMHTPIDAMCTGAGEHCVVGTGCTTTMSCTDASMCDDGVACTLDTCNVGGVCGHQALDSMCSAPTPVCDQTMGCIAGATPQCTSTAQCDDTVACTVDSCGADMMCHHMTVDSLCMAGEICNAAMGCVTRHGCTTAADCMDPSFWNFCDGAPTCTTEFGCMFPTPRVCDDGNHCTTDMCDRTAGTNGACTTACDHTQTDCGSDPACAVAGPTCAGHFQLTPAPMGRCIGASWDLSTITITNTDGVLTITAPDISTSDSVDTSMSTGPTCPSFTATRVINGGCTETYTLTATFSDDNTLSGTFTTDFAGGTLNCGGCHHIEYTFTGMRIP